MKIQEIGFSYIPTLAQSNEDQEFCYCLWNCVKAIFNLIASCFWSTFNNDRSALQQRTVSYVSEQRSLWENWRKNAQDPSSWKECVLDYANSRHRLDGYIGTPKEDTEAAWGALLFRIYMHEDEPRKHYEEMVSLFHNSGVDFNAQNDQGKTFLHYALSEGVWLLFEVVEQMINAGWIDPQLQDDEGNLPIDSAIQHLLEMNSPNFTNNRKLFFNKLQLLNYLFTFSSEKKADLFYKHIQTLDPLKLDRSLNLCGSILSENEISSDIKETITTLQEVLGYQKWVTIAKEPSKWQQSVGEVGNSLTERECGSYLINKVLGSAFSSFETKVEIVNLFLQNGAAVTEEHIQRIGDYTKINDVNISNPAQKCLKLFSQYVKWDTLKTYPETHPLHFTTQFSSRWNLNAWLFFISSSHQEDTISEPLSFISNESWDNWQTYEPCPGLWKACVEDYKKLHLDLYQEQIGDPEEDASVAWRFTLFRIYLLEFPADIEKTFSKFRFSKVHFHTTPSLQDSLTKWLLNRLVLTSFSDYQNNPHLFHSILRILYGLVPPFENDLVSNKEDSFENLIKKYKPSQLLELRKICRSRSFQYPGSLYFIFSSLEKAVRSLPFYSYEDWINIAKNPQDWKSILTYSDRSYSTREENILSKAIDDRLPRDQRLKIIRLLFQHGAVASSKHLETLYRLANSHFKYIQQKTEAFTNLFIEYAKWEVVKDYPYFYNRYFKFHPEEEVPLNVWVKNWKRFGNAG